MGRKAFGIARDWVHQQSLAVGRVMGGSHLTPLAESKKAAEHGDTHTQAAQICWGHSHQPAVV